VARRVLACGVLILLALAWYRVLAVRPSTTAAPESAGATARRLPPGVPPLAVRLDRLDSRPRVAAPAALRDPFHGADLHTAAVQPPSASASTIVNAPAPSPATPVWPQLSLIGIAETRGAQGIVRTAIVAGAHGVLHARPGDLVARVYRLDRIDSDGVELRLLAEDRVLRLPLRP